ncbi:MAG: transposase [Thermoplasmatales archaeon]|nr:transposase [Thermoplasmatales archaeon]MBC7128847.1 transposase [Thermoplasmatales archaeon]
MKETIEKWCKKEGIEVEYTPPYYPQAKGKIERAIRTFNEEFLKLKKVFENVLLLLQEFIEWFNNHRYHMGIHDYPANVYFSKNVTDVT